jgi:biotin carboxylase
MGREQVRIISEDVVINYCTMTGMHAQLQARYRGASGATWGYTNYSTCQNYTNNISPGIVCYETQPDAIQCSAVLLKKKCEAF